ncbi:MAG: hypothetical protein ACXU8O_07465, partial [Asticcacaulis sp.]
MKSAAALVCVASTLILAAGCGGGSGSGGGGSGSTSSSSSASSSSSSSSSSSGGILTPATPPAASVSFEVHSDTGRAAISPLIYGINSGDFTQPADKYLTFNRAGGNRITAYNWETNASNAGSDYFNQNDNFLSSSTVPGAAFTGQIQATLDAG